MIFHPSGGLLYHWRAWRYGKGWEGYIREIEDWLGAWPQRDDELILVGPSGGYSLSSTWLKRYRQIAAFDLDPLASFFFRRRHPGIHIEFHRQDVFWKNGTLSVMELSNILDHHPKADVLFSNVLGQLLVEKKTNEEEWYRFLTRIRERLNGRNWASYHDRFSQAGMERVDHLTGGDWSKGLPRRQFEWPLTPQSQHWIEGVRASD